MKRALLLLLFLTAVLVASAQEITFEATVDRNTVAAGDRFRYTLTLSNADGQITPPNWGAFQQAGGASQSQSMNVMNGRMSRSTAYTWVLAAPDKEGSYTIPAATVRVGGGTIQSKAITMTVTKGAPPAAQGGSGVVVQGGNRDLFMSVTVSKNEVFVGEPVTAVWTLWSRYNELQPEKMDVPDPAGFWVERLTKGERHWEDRLRTLNGLQYRVAIWEEQLLYPQKSGTIPIGPASMSALVGRNFFHRGEVIEFTSNKVDLKVKPLPPGEPADFSGAVGKLEMLATADRTEVGADEAITLTVRVSGQANLKLINAPDLELPGDFESYEPKVLDKIGVAASGISGSRAFEWVIIPRHEGEYVIPPVTMSYFDLGTKSYRTLRSDSIVVRVGAGSGQAQVPGVQRPDRSDVEVLENDIRFIRQGDLHLRAKGEQLFGSWAYWAGMLAPGLLFLGAWAYRRKREGELSDPQGLRRRKADKLARQRLKEAHAALGGGDANTFHTALSKALRGYFGDKLGLGAAEVTMERLNERFGATAEGKAMVKDAEGLLAECDLARFAPSSVAPRQELYDRAVALIGHAENQLKS